MNHDSDPDRNRLGRPAPLRRWLRSDTTALGRIGAHTRQLAGLQRRLQQRLPDSLAGRWQLSGIDNAHVAIIAKSPAWASQLRFRQAVLLAGIREITGLEPGVCRITVEPPRLAGRPVKRPPASRAASDHLARFAAGQDDRRLRNSLQRLARHLRHASPDEGEDDH